MRSGSLRKPGSADRKTAAPAIVPIKKGVGAAHRRGAPIPNAVSRAYARGFRERNGLLRTVFFANPTASLGAFMNTG